MNILNALKQLRDDIKAWVTVNFNALNAKIDEKTIPTDSELDSTSTNPVQNQAIAKEIDSINDRVGDIPVATQISQAINAQEHFSGDYNDLANAPDISEDGSGSMVIADESGNIIFKADAEGIHTTAVSLNGEAAATEKYVDEAVANIDIPEVDFTGYATEDYVDNKVADLVNSAPEALNTLGELAAALENHEDAYDALLETVGGKATHTDLENLKEELSESITAEAEDWKVVDESGNIIFSVDAEGAHTTNLTLSDGKAATETYVDNAIAAIDFPETDLTGYATEKYVDEAIAAIPETDLSDYYTKEQTNAAINTAKEELSEFIVAESDEWKVVDEAGNVIFSVDATGAHTTELTLNGESAATESYVDDAIANIEFPTTDLTDYATKKYVDDAVDGIKIPEVDFTGYATETYVDNKVADLVNSAPEALDTLGELAVALEVHEDAYDALLETVGSKATHTDLENLKEELSESIVAETDEWKVVDENGNIIFSVDATGAHTTSMTLNGQSVEDMIDGKVDKVDGKGLSTNDYTNEDKEKLNSVQYGAEKNVQPDWQQIDETSPDFIKNKTHYEVNISDKESIYTTERQGFSLTGENYNGFSVYRIEVSQGISIFDRYPVGTLFKLVVDSSETVIFEGTKHTDTSAMGNPYLYGGETDTGENCYVYSDGRDCVICVASNETMPAGSLNLKIVYTVSELKQLDEKYIPDTIARTEDVISLPPYTATDEGKILQIVNGVPTWVSLPNAEEATF